MKFKQIKPFLQKLSWVDYLILVVFLSSLLFFYLLLRRYNEIILIRVKVTDKSVLTANRNPSASYANSFQVGDIEKNEVGQVSAEIIRVDSVKISQNEFNLFLDIKIKALFSERSGFFKYKGRPVVYGESFPFTFSKTKFDGLVVDFPGFIDESQVVTRKRLVKAQTQYAERSFSDVYGAQAYIADSIKEGDVLKNSLGEEMVRVVKFEKKPAKRTFINNNGVPFVVYDPVLKDLFFELELTTKTINGQEFMFYDRPVFVGEVVPLSLPKVSVWPTITEIFD